MQKPSTGLAESQPSEWRQTLECAIRERVRELVECILEEELEQALIGASLGTNWFWPVQSG